MARAGEVDPSGNPKVLPMRRTDASQYQHSVLGRRVRPHHFYMRHLWARRLGRSTHSSEDV